MRIATLILGSLLLAGCTPPWHVEPLPSTPKEAITKAKAFEVKTPDGQTVTCVTYDDANFGTELSCDWVGAK